MLIPTQEERNEYLAYKSEQDVINNLKDGISALESCDIRHEENTVLMCGGMAGFDKGLLHFINIYADIEKSHGKRVVLLSEVTGEYRRYTALKVNIPFICTPHLLAKEIIILGMNISVSEEVKNLLAEKTCLQESVRLLKARHPGLGEGYAEVWCFYAYCYIEKLLECIKPEKVILWNQFYAFHRIFEAICRLKNIEVEYMEFGCLPGTIEFDKCGQVGESSIVKKSRRFRRKPITVDETKDMTEVLEYLRLSRLNRNEQPNRLFQKEQIYKYADNKPTVVYLGQNDYESGIYPYTKKARKYHSPVFKSSVEALEFLIRLSIKNNWNFVYKPHPIMKALGLELDNTVEDARNYMVDDVNLDSLIDSADVVVTIFSQSAYMAMIREKPVVMLGYNQLRGKGCTYEAFCQRKIEKKIRTALKAGFSRSQKDNFIKHCTQLKKYYLIDDLQPKKLQTGKKW